MIAAGGLCAWLVYRYFGLKFVSRSWFNLDATWAATLTLVGAISLRAEALRLQGKLDEAEVCLHRVLDVKPDHAPAMRLLGTMARYRGERAGSRKG